MTRVRPPVAPAPLPARPLITADALAAMLSTTRGAIYARHARGGIPGGIRLGRSLRFDPDVIAAWLAQSATSGGLER